MKLVYCQKIFPWQYNYNIIYIIFNISYIAHIRFTVCIHGAARRQRQVKKAVVESTYSVSLLSFNFL